MQAHQDTRLAEALAALVRQIETGDWRDPQGRELKAEGIVVYRLGDAPLEARQGGPIRFLIRNPAACHTDELDDCANVKYLSRIELSVRRGRDTRPADEAAHEALHKAQGG